MRLNNFNVYFKLKAKAQTQADTPNQGTRAQRREHPGGVNVYVTTYDKYTSTTSYTIVQTDMHKLVSNEPRSRFTTCIRIPSFVEHHK